jgi:hypothetical protein
MTSKAIKLLLDIIAPYPGGPSLSERTHAAVALVVEDPDLPVELTQAIDAFLADQDVRRLHDVQRAAAVANLLAIGPRRYVDLVADLINRGQLTTEQGARLLVSIPYVERRWLPPSHLRLVEIADAVVEDAEDGVMAVDDDNLFAQAVQQVLSEEYGRADQT